MSSAALLRYCRLRSYLPIACAVRRLAIKTNVPCKQQLMVAFFRAYGSSTNKTCYSMKDEKQDATVNT